jgi:hypothetical protein
MAEYLSIMCLVLAGPIAISATENAADGDFIELPEGDYTQLKRWGIVREATEAEKSAALIVQEPEPEPEIEEAPRETAAQRKKREAAEAAEAKAAQEAAELAANLETEPPA